MPRITRKLNGVDMGHRLMKHEGKCRNYHGHRYTFEVTIDAKELDKVGRVVDFGVVKDLVGGWLDREWDHGMVLQEGDPLIEVLQAESVKLFTIPVPPTIEHLVKYVFDVAVQLLDDYPVRVVSVRGYETPNCWSDYPNKVEPHGHPPPTRLATFGGR
jgi:6-pyruvoyltetrahydropterin/6-carboxytetrahydropterin synthase